MSKGNQEVAIVVRRPNGGPVESPISVLCADTRNYAAELGWSVQEGVLALIKQQPQNEMWREGSPLGPVRHYAALAVDLRVASMPDLRVRNLNVWHHLRPVRRSVRWAGVEISSDFVVRRGQTVTHWPLARSVINTRGSAESELLYSKQGMKEGFFGALGEDAYATPIERFRNKTRVFFGRLMGGLLMARLTNDLLREAQLPELRWPMGGKDRLGHVLNRWPTTGHLGTVRRMKEQYEEAGRFTD